MGKIIKQNRVFIVLLLIFIGLGLPDSLLSTTWPDLSRDLGLQIGFLSIVTIITTFFSMLSSNNTYKLNKLFGVKNVIILSMVLCMSGVLLVTISKSIIGLIIAQVILGLGAGAIDSNVNLIGSQVLTIGKFNILHGFWGVGITGTALITTIVYSLGYNQWLVYWIIAMLFIVLILVTVKNQDILVLREETQQQEGFSRDEKRSLKDYIGVVIYFGYGVEFIIGIYLTSYLTTSLNIDSAKAAFVVSCYWGGVMVSRLVITKIFEYIPAPKLLKIHAIIVLILAFTIHTTSYPALVLSFVILGYAFGPIYPTFMHFTETIHKTNASYFISKQLSGYYLSVFLGQIIIGYCSKYFGLGFFIYIVSLLLIVLVVAMLVYLKINQEKIN